jgi:2-haloacid dehalogenase
MTAPFDPRKLRALVFDVFGTVVDWRSSIVREGQMLAAAKGLQVDWAAFADAGSDWADIDTLHRQILDGLLPRFGLQSLTEEERVHLNLVWHRLMPWPDAVGGLNRLRGRYPVSTLSNGNVSLLVAMAKHGGLPWDAVLSAELFQHYKPDPEVYLGAARLLDLAPGQLMMVAAHPSDLRAAAACGLRTAYVPRPLERGPGGAMEPWREGEFDHVAPDFHALAVALGA